MKIIAGCVIKRDNKILMVKEELRGYEIGIKTIDDIENNKIYPLDIFDNNKYNS